MPFSTLISVEQLQTQVNDCRLIDCRFNLADPEQGQLTYQAGHLPGAVYAHLDQHLSSLITADSGRHPLPNFDAFSQQVANWAIKPGTQVVAYDDIGGAFASRLWWLLKTIGHENVAVLNGGIQAWQAAGLSLSSQISMIEPLAATAITVIRENWLDVEQLQQQLQDTSCILIDARTAERFRGESEPIDTVAGHIPGAVNQPLPLNTDEQGRFLSPQQLARNYAPHIGPNKAEKIVHMCGSGVFACQAILCMEAAGLGRAKLYPGSWSEWIRDSDRPIATTTSY